ncbi:MAG: IclR family transcriptional regulator [Thermodesulfobacteriota bacterium]
MNYQAPSVRKAFQILEIISEADRGLGISDLAKKMEISKGTVHGITAALEEVGAIIRNPFTKRYTLGFRMMELGNRGLSRIPLRDTARRQMVELADETGENVFLGIQREDYILILDVVESAEDFKITSPSGTKIPLTAGATGKLFLAVMEEKNALNYLRSSGLPKYTQNSVTDLESYFKELREIREKGYATDNEEYLQGVRAVAALIKTEEPVLAAIWVVGFSSSLTNEKMPEVLKRTLHAVDSISRDLKSRH